jgi:outer membrane receptor protein involved in Fe transport
MASVASTYLGAGRNKIFIRGIADSSFTGATQATVGQYYGDLRLSYNAPDPDLRLADLAAVEVLEGPQGTLYGAGSLGGLIRLVPNPVDLVRTSGSAVVGASATAHGRPGLDVQGVANVPLVADRLGIRLVGAVEEQGGYIDKPRLGRANVNRTRIEGGRATAHLAITDDWSAELVGIGQRIVGADSQYTDRGRGLIRDAAVQEGFRAAFAQGQFVVNGRFGDVRFRSSTGLTAHDLRERYDATGPGEAPSLFQQTSKTRMAANETRLWQSGADGTGWLAGLSLTDNRTTLTRAFAHSAMFLPMVGIENAVRETTLYGEGSLRLLPHVLVNGGLRLTHSRIAGGFTDDSARGSTAAGMALTGARRQVVALPAISTLFELSPHSSLFVRYQQSFRPGGLAIDEDFARRFRSDRLGTIEAGYRTGRPNVDPLDLSLTLAYTNWRNIQADFIDGSGFPSTANIGDGRLWTIESNGGVRVADGLRIDTAVTFNASHVDEARELFAFVANSDTGPVTEAQVSARLRQIPNIARITLRQGATYRHVLAAGHELKVDAWARYVGPSRLGVGPILGQKQGDYIDTAVTARLGLGAIGITAGISNLFDARGNRFALGTPFTTGRDQVTPLRPRTVRIGFDAAF